MIDHTPSSPVSKRFPAVQQEFPALWFFLVWLLLAIAATVPFWMGNLDMELAVRFSMISGKEPPVVFTWPHENEPIWRFFYVAAPYLVGLLALGGLSMCFAGFANPRFNYLRPMGLYLILTVAMGPGLFVNALGKEYTGRPRPRQVAVVNDPLPYRAPFQLGKPGEGKSFPCGHCSVGFSFAALWLLLRRRNLWLGRAALVGGLSLGLLMGVGRMAAGAHFFSDVLWAGLMTMLAAGIAYYYIVRMPARWAAWAEHGIHSGAAGQAVAASMTRGQKARAALIFGLAGGVLIFFILLASPVHEDFQYSRPEAGDDPGVVILQVTSAQVQIHLTRGAAEPAVRVEGKVRGFGLPSNKVRFTANMNKIDEVPTFTIVMQRMGLYTDYEAGLQLWLNEDKVRRLSVEQLEGELAIPATTRLELDTDKVRDKVALERPVPLP